MTEFTWHDGDYTIHFGSGVAAKAAEFIKGDFALLTTARARDTVPWLADAASAEFQVAPGRVDEISAALLDEVQHEHLVALGGGRVVDTAKAIVAVRGGHVTAIPTTLSGAEMSRAHRMPRGAHEGATPTRPRVVINDPQLTASQPTALLAGSAANALAHAVEGRVTIRTSPVPSLVAEEAIRLIDVAFYGDEPSDADREKLALASMLAGYVTDSTGIGMHHMLAQVLARTGAVTHASANAALLPHTIVALELRVPGRVDPDGTLVALARKLARIAGSEHIGAFEIDRSAIDSLVEEAAVRPGLDLTPPRATPEEIRAIYQAAW